MKKTISLMLAALMIMGLVTGCKKQAETKEPTTTTPPVVVTEPKEPEVKEPTELKKLVLSEVTHSVFYAPQYAAIALGFFKEEGLDVELISGQGADKVMTAIVAGQADIGLAGPEASVYLYNQGKENHSVLFAQLTKRDGSFLVGRSADPSFEWESLRGKKLIGGRKGGMPEMTLEYVLKSKNIVPHTDVEIDTSVQFALMAGAFIGGQGDYVTLFEPTASMMEKEGKGHILTSMGQDSGEIPYTAYFTAKDYIEKNPETIQKFTNAVYRGQLWIQKATPEEIAKVVAPFFPDTDMEIMTTVAKRYQEIDAWSLDPVLTESSLTLLQDVMESAGELKERASYDKIVNTTFAKEAIKNVK